MAHSVELKQKALAYLGKCKNVSQVASAFGISRNPLYCWIKNSKQVICAIKAAATVPSNSTGSNCVCMLPNTPEAYLREIAQHFNCHPSTVFYALKSMNITLKKDLHLLGTRPRQSQGILKHLIFPKQRQ